MKKIFLIFLSIFLVSCTLWTASKAMNNTEVTYQKLDFTKNDITSKDKAKYLNIAWNQFLTANNFDKQDFKLNSDKFKGKYGFSKDELIIKLVDLNNDGVKDIIYTGQSYFCGTQGCTLNILLSNGFKYTDVFFETQIFKQYPVYILNTITKGLKDIKINNKYICKYNGEMYKCDLKLKPEASTNKLKDYSKYLNTIPSNKPESVLIAKDKYFQLFSLNDSQEVRDTAFLLFQKKYEKIIEVLQDNIGNTVGLDVFDQVKKDEWEINKKRLNEKEIYYKQYGMKVNFIYKGYLPDIDYSYLIKQFEPYISSSMKEYLTFCLKESNEQVMDEGEVLISWDELRKRVIYLEAFIENNPDFAGKKEVQEHLNQYVDIFIGESSSLYGDDDNIRTDAKQSIERFLNENKESKLCTKVLKKYNALKKYNFNIREYYQHNK